MRDVSGMPSSFLWRSAYSSHATHFPPYTRESKKDSPQGRRKVRDSGIRKPEGSSGGGVHRDAAFILVEICSQVPPRDLNTYPNMT